MFPLASLFAMATAKVCEGPSTPPWPPVVARSATTALADREHVYDGGGPAHCPRCAQLEALVRELRPWAVGCMGAGDILRRSLELVP